MSTETLAIVDAWFHEKVQAAPVSHHTECYNQMHAAYQDLRIRLGAEPAAPSSDAGASGSGEEGGGEAETSSQTPGKPQGRGR